MCENINNETWTLYRSAFLLYILIQEHSNRDFTVIKCEHPKGFEKLMFRVISLVVNMYHCPLFVNGKFTSLSQRLQFLFNLLSELRELYIIGKNVQ